MNRQVLAFYSKPEAVEAVLKEFRFRRLRRFAAIHRGEDGRVHLHREYLSPVIAGLLLGTATLAAALLAGLSSLWCLVALAAGIAGGVFAARRLGFGLDRKFLSLYQRWVLPGEVLFVAQARPHDLLRVAGLLRKPEVGYLATFFFRPYRKMDEAGSRGFQSRESLSGERLKSFATHLASTHKVAPPGGRPLPIQDYLGTIENDLEAARQELSESARLNLGITQAAEWLLDNGYIIHGHIAEFRRNLPAEYYDVLPTIEGETGVRGLRVYDLVSQFLSQTDCLLTSGKIRDFLTAYQSVSTLTIAELWVLPLIFRYALVEELQRRSEYVNWRQHERELADFWANRLLNATRRGPSQLLLMLAELAKEQPLLQPHFAVRLTGHLYDEEAALAPVQNWLERQLDAPLQEVIRQEQGRQAGDQISIANAVTSLRFLAQLDWKEIFEDLSQVEGILRKDPSEIYANTDFDTRDRCRQAVEELARYSDSSESEAARLAVQLAGQVSGDDARTRHVGFYLIDQGRSLLESRLRCRMPRHERMLRWVKAHAVPFYIGAVSVVALLLVAIFSSVAFLVVGPFETAGLLAAFIAAVLLSCFPAGEIALQTVNFLVSSLLPPQVLAKMSFKEGIPDDCRTLVVNPMMLLTKESIEGQIERLETHYLANRDENLHFGLLTDFADAPEREMPGDEALLETAVRGIEVLNDRYPGNRFFLFHRPRTWSQSEQLWIGWERKRGKLEELNCYLNRLAGNPDPEGRPLRQPPDDFLLAGELEPLHGVRFVITLDADTQLPHETARRLIETLAHPLNRPRVSPDSAIVTDGFTVIQPRVSTSLPAATATHFTRLFTDQMGTDPYVQAVSDVHQDLFGEGIYHGKAIYDVQAFHRVLSGRFPEATLLSHDLIEGCHVRVGLATDIELLEQYPAYYRLYARRQHRWIRGDWQISSWGFSKVPSPHGRVRNPLSFISRWKILDNLRRSLVPVAAVLLLLLAWSWHLAPAVWGLLIALMVLIPGLLQLPNRLGNGVKDGAWDWENTRKDLLRGVIHASLLPHQAGMSVDAILKVWYRRLVSRRGLLEWESAQVSHWRAAHQITRFQFQVTFICLMTALLVLLLPLEGFAQWAAALPFLILWLLSPALADWVDKETEREAAPELDESERRYLRALTRQTWRYFETHVGPHSNWLPPDNSQESLRVEVAMRTSPTNIGLWMLSVLAARDLGYLGVDGAVERLEATVDTLSRLERYEGHFLNWYDISTLEPLRPMYVSTVDSGNLLACFWALRQGVRELVDEPIVGSQTWKGLMDTLMLVHGPGHEAAGTASHVESLRNLFKGDGTGGVLERIRRLRNATAPCEALVETLKEDGGGDNLYWAECLAEELAAWNRIVDRYLGWVMPLADLSEEVLSSIDVDAPLERARLLSEVPSLKDLANGEGAELMVLCQKSPGACPKRLAAGLRRARESAAEMLNRIHLLDCRLEEMDAGTNLRFLYDEEKRIFSIGYNVSLGSRDNSYYDLLASEARLASLVAIARGEIPLEHWLSLGRPYGAAGRERVLLSWSGTMFEYLMPVLFTKMFEHSLLDDACYGAVRRQIAFGQERGVPWGISESAFSALDVHQTYQYKAFGVPGLGLKRGLEEDIVVSPYSTALALMVAPRKAVQNFRKLEELGVRGDMGFYEAIDFTRPSRPGGDRGVIVYAYMAHHQAMSLLAFSHVLTGAAMQRRFHSDLRVRTVEPLLFERIPVATSIFVSPSPDRPPARLISAPQAPGQLRVFSQDSPFPKTHLMCNGAYAVMLTNSGGGYSRWNEFDITRWRADTTRDHHGSFCYVKDRDSGHIWSTAYHPVDRPERRYSVTFMGDRAEYRRRDAGIETVTEIVVSPESDAEIRRITLLNRSGRVRRLDLTSYAELSLAPHNADRAHPAFSKLFVQTRALPEKAALLAWRRMRSPEEPPLWAGHLVTEEKVPPAPLLTGAAPIPEDAFKFATDRAAFIGRGRDLHNPVALEKDLDNSAGFVLDPVFSIRKAVTLAPGQKLRIAFVTMAGGSEESVLALINQYCEMESCNRAFDAAWTHAQLEHRYLGIRTEEAQRFQELAAHMLFPNNRLRPNPERLRRNALGQSRLWAYGISGDLPVLVVTVADSHDLDKVREILLAHNYWRVRGLKVDLVILNEEAGGYEQTLQNQLMRLIQAHTMHTGVDRPGGVFLRSVEQIPEEDLTLLLASGRAHLIAARGNLGRQLGSIRERPETVTRLQTRSLPEEPSAPLPFLHLPYFNGIGGFTEDGREYAIYLGPETVTPAPWVNVIANPEFGVMVSESGVGFTWYGNSQANRLTPWNNDPVSGAASEAIYIRDEDTGVYWTPTPLPIRENDAYRARHGQGYTVFEHNSHAINQELLVLVPMDDEGGDPIRVQRLRLHNASRRRRRLTVTTYAEWVLGADREETQLHIVTSWDEESHAIFARNAYHPDFGQRIAFAALSPRARAFSGDRTEFIGRNGSSVRPAALTRKLLSGRLGPGLDPCAALQVEVTLDPGETDEIVYLFGQARDMDQARTLIRRYQDPYYIEEAQAVTPAWWDSMLGHVQVDTPDLALNFLMNRWLLYQNLSCRFWARSAFYQSGGAFGFRDQLQDSMALLHSAPDVVREHIIRCAQHQFIEGDVQHWWHPPAGGGVRTRCSDDMLWLPLVTAHYIRTTGDVSILDTRAYFLDGRPLEKEEHEIYLVPTPSLEDGTLWEHCRRAVDKGLNLGPHGLPLIGSGDWNDGMNRVGSEGRGESVWLAWFLITVLRDFADITELHGKEALARKYRKHAAKLQKAVEEHAWDGEWYLRAFFDDGTPMGSKESPEARIDAIPQSWAVLSGAADPSRAARAIESVEKYLIRKDDGIVLIFTPPFQNSSPHPGYIMGYPPGVRENGGQYTHAALWTAQALARLGLGDRAVQLLRMLNPVEHARTPEAAGVYRGEPYSVAADVYSLEGHVGRAGWTWYTGSAGWMYRIWLEDVLGFRRQGDKLTVDPVIPGNWSAYTISYRYGSSRYKIRVENPKAVNRGVLSVEVNSVDQPDKRIPLRDDGGHHTVRVVMG
jgi:cyclic beta-1,2-glucan synthetase